MTENDRQDATATARYGVRRLRNGRNTARIGGARRFAYVSLLIERVWPLVLPIACLLSAFLALSWFGLFAALPFVARIAALVVLVALGLAALWRNRGLRMPSRRDVDGRIEAVSRLRHQPLQAQDARSTSDDPFAKALWREHQRRMAAELKNLAGGAPNTRTERLDPFGLRAVLALLLVTAFAYSYGPGGGRLADAFTPAPGEEVAGARVDAWVTPPTYTGRAPIFLTEASPTTGPATGPVTGAIEVPEGSVLSVRLSEGSGAAMTFTREVGSGETAQAETIDSVDDETKDGEAPVVDGKAVTGSDSRPASDSAAADDKPEPGPREFAYTLKDSGTAHLGTSFSTLGNWAFSVQPDENPNIAFKGEPSEARNGALQLAYTVSDDYGVRKAEAEIVVRDETVADDARPVVATPKINLSVPRRKKGAAEGKSSADLAESPYAGARVAMTLVATDDAGQIGRSQTKTLTLPEKRFSNPLARAVIEQRRMLALDANAVPRVIELLDATTLRGDEFIANPSDYLALKVVRTRIATAYDDAALVSAVDFMWQIALGIEDGNLSLSERRLRDAREKLSQALENGASNEEIDQLMKELREAMNEYMQALAEEMQKMPPMDQNQMGQAQELRPQDLDKMMDRIEDLAKSGSKDAAQQLLSELQQMMDNLQAMRPGQQQQGGEQNAMQQQMNKMGEMLQRQQQLMDKTFDLGRQQIQRQQLGQQQGRENRQQQQGQQGQSQEGQPMTAEQLDEAMKKLQEQQGQLQKDLQAMRKQMQGMGMEPSKGFGQAGEAMGKAEGALGKGDDGEAVGQQGRAMQALRDGAKDAMQQMQQAMQQGQGQQGQQPGQGQMGQGFGGQQPQQSSRDPLGRQRQTQGPDFGQDVGVPDEIDTQRAREILDAIRKRLGDQLSPELERQYLERLLKTP